MSDSRWPGKVVAVLLSCKAQGVPFERAWREALTTHPPRGSASEATLFDEAGEPHDTTVAFLKRVTRNAYDDVQGPVGEGNGPAIGHFRGSMLRDLDSSTPARKHRRAA